jgi:hypothetical protein
VRARDIFDASDIFTSFDDGDVAIGWQMDDESGRFANDLYVGGLDVTVVDGIEGYPISAADVGEALVFHTHSATSEWVADAELRSVAHPERDRELLARAELAGLRRGGRDPERERPAPVTRRRRAPVGYTEHALRHRGVDRRDGLLTRSRPCGSCVRRVAHAHRIDRVQGRNGRLRRLPREA